MEKPVFSGDAIARIWLFKHTVNIYKFTAGKTHVNVKMNGMAINKKGDGLVFPLMLVYLSSLFF